MGIWIENEGGGFDLWLLEVAAGHVLGRLIRRLVRVVLGLRAAIRQKT